MEFIIDNNEEVTKELLENLIKNDNLTLVKSLNPYHNDISVPSINNKEQRDYAVCSVCKVVLITKHYNYKFIHPAFRISGAY